MKYPELTETSREAMIQCCDAMLTIITEMKKRIQDHIFDEYIAEKVEETIKDIVEAKLDIEYNVNDGDAYQVPSAVKEVIKEGIRRKTEVN